MYQVSAAMTSTEVSQRVVSICLFICWQSGTERYCRLVCLSCVSKTVALILHGCEDDVWRR